MKEKQLTSELLRMEETIGQIGNTAVVKGDITEQNVVGYREAGG